MSDDNTVDVPVTDLALVRAALNSAFHHSTVLDLAEQYRRLSQRNASSSLTKSLGNALSIVDSYINLADNDESTADQG